MKDAQAASTSVLRYARPTLCPSPRDTQMHAAAAAGRCDAKLQTWSGSDRAVPSGGGHILSLVPLLTRRIRMWRYAMRLPHPFIRSFSHGLQWLCEYI